MITPHTLQGFQDYLPQEMRIRQHVQDVWREIFEKYGYSQMETPSLEYADILFGKYGEEEKLIYHFKDHGERHVALRYDQTVPLARAVAQHLNKGISLPFKRYEISRVWRADAARKARKREFYQCDADILGSSSLLCEADILSLLHEGFKNLKLPQHVINISHRSLLQSFLRLVKLPNTKMADVFRSVDKLDKIGRNGVESELQSRKISAKIIPLILEFIDFPGKDNNKALKHLKKNLSKDPEGLKAIKELEELIQYLSLYEIDSKNYHIQPALVRGLDYYTGIIFEVNMPEFGSSSFAGGGRYDNLCHNFSENVITGTGVGIGFEPICSLIQEKKLFENQTNTDILVTVFEEGHLKTESLKIAHNLRKKGLKTELYFETDNIGKQIKYADRNNIRYVLIYGSDEDRKAEILLKNMKSGKQEKIEKQKFLLTPGEYL